MDWDQFTDRLGNFGERFGKGLKRVFGSANERMVRQLEPLVKEVADLEPWAQGLSAEDFKAETQKFKAAVAAEELDLDELLPQAFALVREASVRTLGLRHFDVQIVGGIILHRGGIAEMMTGEGKTLVATLPLYLNALSGKPAFLVTVNDYLARRDATWMSPIYEYLGVTWGAIQSSMDPSSRHPVYERDIVYGTNNEFGFDYLRDNMKTRLEDQVQRTLNFAIIDEVDSILIDEARTPLIISGPAELMPDKYKQADRVARALVAEVHYEVKDKERQVSLMEEGIEEAEKLLGVDSFYTPGNTDWPHYIENSLRAHALYELDKEYVVENGEVVIVDEFTGRKMAGRRWSDGMHQAVEVKEGLAIRQENQTLATITFQNYFRLYGKLAGMTGTATTEAEEFHRIYGMDVFSVPTNLPLARVDGADVVYRTEPEKWKAIVEEIETVSKGRAADEEAGLEAVEGGQPILVGTTSIENSEKLSGMLRRRGVVHEVLNAKNHEREARIVCKAGEKGAVTVSTNMAGRGTDIKLGGNFEFRLKEALDEAGLVEGDLEHLEEIDVIRQQVRSQCDLDEQEVLRLGGLYVLGTERHEARRIDNQLRGRSGRQGNAGTSRFFLSLEDPLMRRFYRDWVKNFMEKLGMTEGQAIESAMVSRAIMKAQKKVEDYYFEIRKNLLEYDEVMDEQRKTIYGVRQAILEGEEQKERIEEMIGSMMVRAGTTWAGDVPGYQGWFQRTFGFEVAEQVAQSATDGKDMDSGPALEAVMKRYAEREQDLGSELMRKVENYLLMRTIDSRWKDHLHAIDSLKAGIGLRGYAQKDPKSEYKREGFELFQRLLEAVEDEVSSLVLRVEVARPGEGGGPPPGLNPGAPPPGQAGRGPGGTGVQRPQPPQRRTPPVSAGMAFDQARRIDMIRRAQAAAAAQRQQKQAAAEAAGEGAAQSADAPAKAGTETQVPEVGRNEPCPCGSGLKYKKCHGREK